MKTRIILYLLCLISLDVMGQGIVRRQKKETKPIESRREQLKVSIQKIDEKKDSSAANNVVDLSGINLLGIKDTCEAFYPRVFCRHAVIYKTDADKIATSTDYGQNQQPSGSKQYWIAYSDHDENTTYKASSISSGIYSHLSFNEKVRIAKIQNGFALVYHEPEGRYQYPNISSNAVIRGWIPMSKLLLWCECPILANGSTRKALDKGTSGLFSTSLEPKFYYIMKQVSDSVLLSTAPNLYFDSVLKKWVNIYNIDLWENNICWGSKNYKTLERDEFLRQLIPDNSPMQGKKEIPFVCCTLEELSMFMQSLEPINRIALNQDKKSLCEAINAMELSIIPNKSSTEIEECPISSVIAVLIGINPSILNKNDLTIKDIKNLSIDELTKITSQFCKKYRYLQNVKSKGYRYSFAMNNEKIYFIPVESFPLFRNL